jgi:hypothetical protein
MQEEISKKTVERAPWQEWSHPFPLPAIDKVTIQMQNLITGRMGRAYAGLLGSEFCTGSGRYWRRMIRSPADFDGMNSTEIARQVHEVKKTFVAFGKS